MKHLIKSEMDLFDTSLIGLWLLFLSEYFNTGLNEYRLLWMCFVSINYPPLWWSEHNQWNSNVQSPFILSIYKPRSTTSQQHPLTVT